MEEWSSCELLYKYSVYILFYSFLLFIPEPCPSRLFQGHVKEVMMSDEGLTTAFLNSLLNQLNWAFSEFIGMLQEVTLYYSVT
jgi:Kip1 ubiquitination-promoting complex protein 1